MYLAISDIQKGIRPEVLQIITRFPENLEQAINEAVAEVTSYLTARYNTDLEFVKTPEDNRVTMVVKLVRDITIYNCHNIAAPAAFPENRKNVYENTIKFLRDVQAEKASIPGLERKTTDNGEISSNYIAYNSEPKRTQQF
jgi:phage gp36-like protein